LRTTLDAACLLSRVTPTGASGEIADGGVLSTFDLGQALRVQEAPELDSQGEDNYAEPLGLHYHEGSTGFRHSWGNTATPGVLQGTRHGRQVFIRIGWLGEGPPMYFLTFRMNRLRFVTALRVEAPEFQLGDSGGRLIGDGATPPAVSTLIQGLAPSPAVWRELRVLSGPEGIVASRRIGRSSGALGSWVHDLWLLERLADVLDAEPLPHKRLKRDWTVPYGLGERVPK
jgi:hypothetical protein